MSHFGTGQRSTKVPREWLTQFELSDQKESPRYAETMAYFNKLAASSPHAKMFTFGVSPQGRDLNYLVVSNSNEFSPQQVHNSRKAIVLIQNGIHAGEIEGKDASMLLLRDILITKEKSHLLENLILLVIPILNVDGHERISPANGPNQNGPAQMGWRTTSQNLNLNRDYMKADASEMQALLKLYSSWLPDFIIDNHTTNGADYQYHITYGIERHQNINTSLSAWANNLLMPFVTGRVEKAGFRTGPYISARDSDLRNGITMDATLPRYSTGYAAAQNRLCLLVETHSLKPFGNRVHSTKATAEAVLEYIHTHTAELKKLNQEADSRATQNFGVDRHPLPVELEVTDESRPFTFKGFESFEEDSPLTGSPVIKYSSTPVEFKVPLYDRTTVVKSVVPPFAYCIPEQFSAIIQRMQLHGIEVETVTLDQHCIVERYRFKDVRFAARPYEGRQRVKCSMEKYTEEVFLPRGTFVVPTQQRAVRVIVNLLEPEAPDSYVQWGFFNTFFERKEYAEPYVMEPIARQMIKDDTGLKEEFYERLDSDEAFRNDPAARLDFFYRRSPYFDSAENVYPIMRIVDHHIFAALKGRN
ncbi:MAG: M14 family metallopeptidase [Bacteroidota bacterium]